MVPLECRRHISTNPNRHLQTSQHPRFPAPVTSANAAGSLASLRKVQVPTSLLLGGFTTSFAGQFQLHLWSENFIEDGLAICAPPRNRTDTSRPLSIPDYRPRSLRRIRLPLWRRSGGCRGLPAACRADSQRPFSGNSAPFMSSEDSSKTVLPSAHLHETEQTPHHSRFLPFGEHG